jgi:multidrug efflux pump subunit AcrB
MMVIGAILFFKIPISLLPSIQVPTIVIKTVYPNASAELIEQSVSSKIRNKISTVRGLKSIDSKSTDHTSYLTLSFEQGTKMDIAFIDLNESIDYIISDLPKGVSRPQIVNVNTSDIPIIRLQVVPRKEGDYLAVSKFTEQIIRKKLQQIDGVSLVDLNGTEEEIITIELKKQQLLAANVSEDDIEQAIRMSNIDLGAISVKEGELRYSVKFSNKLDNIDEISAITVTSKSGGSYLLSQFAELRSQVDELQGMHIYNGVTGLVITIHKQDHARMNELVPEIISLANEMNRQYPDMLISVTQDQTYLLNEGIQNLTQDLWFGGGMCILLLFLLIGNHVLPILMSISIPISLLITCILFYVFKISFNIISLSGLTLGIGMLIDNSIIVLDNISRIRALGNTVEESCISGVNEVVSPIISNVLTTISIYLPLIYLSGMAGALIYEQAIALTISLVISLFVAFCLNPLLYKLFAGKTEQSLNNETRLFKWISKQYHNLINHVFKYKLLYFVSTLCMMPLSLFLLSLLPTSTLPNMIETQSLVKIDWNNSISLNENKDRVLKMSRVNASGIRFWEADLGLKQFMFQQNNSTTETSEIFYSCVDEQTKNNLDAKLTAFLSKFYPEATFSIENAPNAFTQLFENNDPYFEARFRPMSIEHSKNWSAGVEKLLLQMPNSNFTKGIGFQKKEEIQISVDYDKLNLYSIKPDQVLKQLNRYMGNNVITEIKRLGYTRYIKLKSTTSGISESLQNTVVNPKGFMYPLSTFLTYEYSSENKFIQSDLSGNYQSIFFFKDDIKNIDDVQNNISKLALENGYSVTFHGKYFADKALFGDLIFIFLVSLLLLYFILAVQFQNFVHPIIVMLTIPLGIGGAVFILWLTDTSLNIMSAIGFVVVLGIIVDDPSLKIETINRLRHQYIKDGMTDKEAILIKALHKAGEICLKPLLMVSLTTSLALLPVFFTNGIGNDLQKPLAYVIIGGLTIGTFVTLWFIPLAYWYAAKKNL